jgi:hypothetical protein
MAKSLTELVQVITGGITTVASFAAAVAEFTKKLEWLHQKFVPPATPWLPWLALAVALLLGLSLLHRGLSRKSRLLRPEALLINPDNPAHLRGRTEEIARLSEAVVSHPLVFIEGESGSGKSALVRSGLIPALRADEPIPSVLPVYVNAYPGDWEQGLANQLAMAAWRDLGESPRERLGLATLDDLRRRLLHVPADIDDAPGLLYRIRNELGLTPLLIFDQFDDYELIHRERFLRDGRWITPDTLTADNGLWQAIRADLERRALHCLFVTRRELFSGLEAVRFERPDSHFLDRLEPAYITALLEQLVSTAKDDSPIISNPDAGWEALKDRLLRDLSARGRILPIQARVVFRGLIELSYLSIGAYQRKGGIDGLEAGYIEDAIGAAARAASIPETRVLDALLQLVDETDPELPKARAATTEALQDAAQSDRSRSDRMLQTLEQLGVVRRHVGDLDTTPSSGWSLYHDYLATPVLAAHRRANRWQHLLRDRLRDFRVAADWRARWRAMLSPLELLRLIWPTLHGRLHWAGYREFAVLSGLRLLPLVALLTAVSTGSDWYLNERAEVRANLILIAIRSGENDLVPGREEYRQLWYLAAGSQRLKQVFLERALEEHRSQVALAANAPRIAQALFGLDVDHSMRETAMNRALAANSPGGGMSASLVFRALLGELIYRSAPSTFQQDAGDLFAVSVKAIAATTDVGQLSHLVHALGALGERLPAAQAEASARRLVEAMSATTDGRQLSHLVDALGALGERLPAAQAEASARRLVEAMSATTDGRQLSHLVDALGALGERLPAAQAEASARRLVEAMSATTDGNQLLFLTVALGKLGKQLPAAQAEAGARRLIEAISTTTDQKQALYLGTALGNLGKHLPVAQAEVVGRRLVETMSATTDGNQLLFLTSALGKLGKQLPAVQSKAVARRVVEAMSATTDGRQLSMLSYVLSKFGERLPAAQAEAGARRLIEVISTTTDRHELENFAGVLLASCERLPVAQAEAVARRLVEAMAATTNWMQLSLFGYALGELGEQLPASQAEAGGRLLVDAMSAITDGEQAVFLGKALGNLGKHLPAAQAEAGGRRLVEEMVATTDENKLNDLCNALVDLVERLPAAQGEAVARRLTEAMDTTMDGVKLSYLGKSLGKLGKRLTTAQAEAVARRLIQLMAAPMNKNELSDLSDALGALGERMPAAQAEAVARRLVELMYTTTDKEQLRYFGATLRKLGERLPWAQAEAGARRLIEVMAATMSGEELSNLSDALGALGERLPAAQAEVVARRLVEAMAATMNENELSDLGAALDALGERLSVAQAKVVARRLVEAMAATTDEQQLSDLGEALGKLGERLPAAQAEVVARRLVEAMVASDKASTFQALAASIAALPVPPNPMAADTALDLLQAPMAIRKTRAHLLRYYSRLAGPLGADDFKDTDAFVQWVERSRPKLDLDRRPRIPRGLVR